MSGRAAGASLTDEALLKGINESLKTAADGKANFTVSPEEADRVKQAFEKKEFRDMFREYLEEISDPKAREEQEKYLQQLEKENSIPDDMKIVKPQVGFCIKTTNKPDKSKVFVNVCAAEEVDMPTSKGAAWQLPMMAGKPRYEKDNKGDLCLTMDVVFHPNALRLSSAKAAFKQMVAQAAVERAQELMVRFGTGDAAKLQLESTDFKILKQKACMGGTPAVIRVPKSEGQSTSGSQAQKPPPKAPAAAGASAPAAAQGRTAASAAPPKAAPKKAAAQPSPPSYLEEGEQCPTVRITERGVFDLSQTMPIPGGGASTAPPRRPAELVVRVELPQCKNAKGVQLDVAARALTLIKPGVYRLLHHPLPYDVNADAAGAKFDKSKRILEVTLPVLPPAQAVEPVVNSDASSAPPSAPAVESPVADKRESESPPPSMEEAPPKPTDAQGTGAVKHDRWVASSADSSALDAETAAAVKAAAAAPPQAPQPSPAPPSETHTAHWRCRYGEGSSTILVQVPHIDEASVKAHVYGAADGAPLLTLQFKAAVEAEQLEEHIAAAGGVDNMVLRHVPRTEGPASTAFAAKLTLPGAVKCATFDVVELNMVLVLEHEGVWSSGICAAKDSSSPSGPSLAATRSDIAGAAPKTRAAPVPGGEAVTASPAGGAASKPPASEDVVLEVNESGEFDAADTPSEQAPSAGVSSPPPSQQQQHESPGSASRRRRGGRRGASAAALELE